MTEPNTIAALVYLLTKHAVADRTAEIATMVVLITPEVAAELLKRNTRNRPVSTRRVQSYARKLKDGRWKLNGETICFSRTGALLQGQHRLHACIVSGAPMISLVAVGFDDDVFDTYDSGKSRTPGDVLGGLGEKSSRMLAAALGCVAAVADGRVSSKGWESSEKDEIRLLLERYPGVRDSVRLVASCKVGTANATKAAAHYLFSLVDRDVADAYIDRVLHGTMIDKRDPEYVVRVAIERGSKQSALNRGVELAYLIKGWNARLSGRAIAFARFTDDERFPTIDGLDPAKIAR